MSTWRSIAGVELELHEACWQRRESGITAGLALDIPMLNGCLAAIVLLKFSDGWVADKATHTQFMLDIGMAWAVTTLSILSVGRQLVFLLVFAAFGWGFRRLLPRLSPSDRWNAALIWLIACALGADWCGLHFMVGAFLAGRILGWDKGESRLIG